MESNLFIKSYKVCCQLVYADDTTEDLRGKFVVRNDNAIVAP